MLSRSHAHPNSYAGVGSARSTSKPVKRRHAFPLTSDVSIRPTLSEVFDPICSAYCVAVKPCEICNSGTSPRQASADTPQTCARQDPRRRDRPDLEALRAPWPLHGPRCFLLRFAGLSARRLNVVSTLALLSAVCIGLSPHMLEMAIRTESALS